MYFLDLFLYSTLINVVEYALCETRNIEVGPLINLMLLEMLLVMLENRRRTYFFVAH